MLWSMAQIDWLKSLPAETRLHGLILVWNYSQSCGAAVVQAAVAGLLWDRWGVWVAVAFVAVHLVTTRGMSWVTRRNLETELQGGMEQLAKEGK